jgi:hypothetical protein
MRGEISLDEKSIGEFTNTESEERQKNRKRIR